MKLTATQTQAATDYYNSLFRVRERTTTGYKDHFYPDYERAYRATKRFLEEDGATKVEIKSPGGDYLRVFGPGMVQVK